jgi:hypothetical protein
MKNTLIIICATISLAALVSCETVTGENGVVLDSATGQRLAGVAVTMFSDNNDTDITDSLGYFIVGRLEPCGLKECPDYSIQFVKEGYDTLLVSSDYAYTDETTYLGGDVHDTLIVNLIIAE